MFKNFVTIDLELFALINGQNTNGTVESGTMGTGTVNSDLSPELKTFYDRALLESAQANLVHDQFGQKRPIPKGNGKTIEFRKFDALPKAIAPIQEGVTPKGNKISVTAVTATVDQYGDFVETSDVLDLTAFDPILTETTKALGKQAGLTLDTITRDIINSGTNVTYASKWSGTTETAVTSRSGLDSTSKLTVDTIMQVVAKLRANNAPTIDGDFVAIAHPYVLYDLMRDPEWIESHKYATPENLYKGEVGKVGGVRFISSSEAKIFGGEFSTGVSKLTVNVDINAGATSVITSSNFASALTNVKVVINGTTYTASAATNSPVLTLTEGLKNPVRKGTPIYKADNAVFSTLVFGKDAYGITEITGGGLEIIVKQKGSAGSADPLNQRGTVGWKAIKTAEILYEPYMVRIESCSPRFSATAVPN